MGADLMRVHDIAEAWAGKLCTLTGRTDPYQKALAAYAIEGFTAVMYGMALLAALAWLAGAFWESLAAAAAAAILKTFTGGAHMSTPTRCALAGAVVFTGLGLAAKYLFHAGLYPPLLWLLLALDNLLVWVYAPVAVPEKPLGEKQRLVLGAVARLAIALQALAHLLWGRVPWLTAFALGGSFQCLSLSKTGRRLVAILDRTLSRGGPAARRVAAERGRKYSE